MEGRYDFRLLAVKECTMLLIFIDAGQLEFKVEDNWVSLLEILLLTVIAAYFGGRTIEKTRKK